MNKNQRIEKALSACLYADYELVKVARILREALKQFGEPCSGHCMISFSNYQEYTWLLKIKKQDRLYPVAACFHHYVPRAQRIARWAMQEVAKAIKDVGPNSMTIAYVRSIEIGLKAIASKDTKNEGAVWYYPLIDMLADTDTSHIPEELISKGGSACPHNKEVLKNYKPREEDYKNSRALIGLGIIMLEDFAKDLRENGKPFEGSTKRFTYPKNRYGIRELSKTAVSVLYDCCSLYQKILCPVYVKMGKVIKYPLCKPSWKTEIERRRMAMYKILERSITFDADRTLGWNVEEIEEACKEYEEYKRGITWKI